MVGCVGLLIAGCDSDHRANREFGVNYSINRNAKASWAVDGAQEAVDRDKLGLAEAYLRQLRSWHYGIPVAAPNDSPKSFEELMAMANSLEIRTGRSVERETEALSARDRTQAELERAMQKMLQAQIDDLISSNDLESLSEGVSSEDSYEAQVERVHRNLNRKFGAKLARESNQ